MPIDPASPRSRRAVLAAALGGLAASAAAGLGRPLPARAADGDPVIVGGEYSADSVTKFTTTSPGVRALWGESATAVGVYGSTPGGGVGVQGYSPGGTGLYGVSDTNIAIYGMCQSGYALRLEGRALDRAAAFSWATGSNTGVFGYSSTDTTHVIPTSATKTGVYGLADQGTSSIGVLGESPAGTGVLATTATGTALHVAGKAQFSRSGRATVAKGKAYADITVAGGLTSHSMVQATLQTYRTGVAIAAVKVTNQGAGKARIYLTKVASLSAVTYVGWLVTEY